MIARVQTFHMSYVRPQRLVLSKHIRLISLYIPFSAKNCVYEPIDLPIHSPLATFQITRKSPPGTGLRLISSPCSDPGTRSRPRKLHASICPYGTLYRSLERDVCSS